METIEYLRRLMGAADPRGLPLRLKDWNRTIRWVVDGRSFFWSTAGGTLSWAAETVADFTLTTSRDTLHKIVVDGFPFFLAIWGTGEIRFDCSFGDAYRLGYVFLRDRRKRRVIFVSHCWLNINTRFPEGAAFEGANTALIGALLEEGLGIIQMPCPEHLCLGLEKYDYGRLTGAELRACFRACAEGVASQVRDYVRLGFEVVGIMGMNPSPSCGVETTKGRGTMEGTDRDTSEKTGPGMFTEELQKLLHEADLGNVPVFGIRRTLAGEAGLEQRVEELRRRVRKPGD